MDFSVPVVQLQAQLLEYQSQQKEIERKLQQPDTDQSELQGLLDDIKEIIAAYKEVLQSKGVATSTVEQDKKKPVSSAPPTLKGITKKKSKGRKDQALKERVLSWQQFHSKHGARRKSIFQSPEEGSRTRVGFQGSPGTLTAIPPRKKHEFVNLNQDN